MSKDRLPLRGKRTNQGGKAASDLGFRLQAGGKALRHRNFQLFFSGQLISLVGTWMQSVAQSWLVYRLTGSGLLLGSVGFVSQIPVFLVAPLGGIAADRLNRQRIVIATQVASLLLAFVLAWLTLSGRIQVWHVFVLAGLLGVVNAFDIPGRQSFLVDMVEGFRFVIHTAPIRALLLLLGLLSVTGMPYVVLMPIFADHILHGGARGLGILMGGTGVGALLGALTLAFRSGVKGLGRWIMWCCAGFGASLVLFSLSRSFWLSVILLLPVGYFIMLQMACSNTLIQVMVPDALRGRVMAVYSMMFMGMAPIGALLGGALSDRLGAPLTVAIGGIASIGAAVWFGLHLPKIRVEARQLIVAQTMAGGEPAEEMTTPVVDE